MCDQSEEPERSGELRVKTVRAVEMGPDEIVMLQAMHSRIKEKVEILSKPKAERSKAESHKVNGFKLRKGVLFKTDVIDGNEHVRFVVPAAARKCILVLAH